VNESHFFELYVIHDSKLYSNRHSGAGRNPDNYQDSHAVGQYPKHGVVRYAELYDKLDSGLRRNDEVVNFAYCCTRLECCLQLCKDQ